MKINYQYGFKEEWIDKILELHNKTDLRRSVDLKEKFIKAYKARFSVVSAWINEELVGFGTMISDGEMYSSIFDVVIDPKYQKKGIGHTIIDKLMATAPGTCVHLTSTFGNEHFYQKIGFKKHKTAFAKYPWESNYLE